MKRLFLLLLSVILSVLSGLAQYPVIQGVSVKVFFNKEIRTWDGFGFNYVETAQTPDYKDFKQPYGGIQPLSVYPFL